MPKRVDHEQRREQIINAVCRVAAERGLRAVTLREVSAEMGVAMGTVQYYFPDMHALLLATLEWLAAAGSKRITAYVEAAEPTPRQITRGCLLAAIPSDKESYRQALVAQTFVAAALTDDRLAAVTKRYPGHLQQVIAAQVEQARADLDAQHEANGLLAMTSGLASSVLLGEHTAEEAVATLDYHLGRIFNGD